MREWSSPRSYDQRALRLGGRGSQRALRLGGRAFILSPGGNCLLLDNAVWFDFNYFNLLSYYSHCYLIFLSTLIILFYFSAIILLYIFYIHRRLCVCQIVKIFVYYYYFCVCFSLNFSQKTGRWVRIVRLLFGGTTTPIFSGIYCV